MKMFLNYGANRAGAHVLGGDDDDDWEDDDEEEGFDPGVGSEGGGGGGGGKDKTKKTKKSKKTGKSKKGKKSRCLFQFLDTHSNTMCNYRINVHFKP